MMRAARSLGCLVVVSVLGCGAKIDDEYPQDTTPPLSGDPVGISVARQVFVFVVDDTAAGAPLREQLAASFATLDTPQGPNLGYCEAPADPARWSPVDRSVVIVHPSASGDDRFSSPANIPALRWQEANRSDAGRAAWLAAIEQALASPAIAGAPFQALAAFDDTASLLYAQRAANTTGEQAMLASLPSITTPAISIVVATDDASPGVADQYHRQKPAVLIAPTEAPNQTELCRSAREQVTAAYRGWVPDAQPWACAEPQFFPTLTADCVTACINPLPVAADGSVACVVRAEFPGTAPCPSELGWIDPVLTTGVRGPALTTTSAISGPFFAVQPARICEIQQLTGAALDACRHDLSCEGCEPGWCVTQVPSLVPDNRCDPEFPGTSYPPFRFVLGADSIPAGALSLELGIDCGGLL